MRRREFITLLGGAVVAWPLTARAQQPERMRRVGVLTFGTASTAGHLVEAFFKGMADLGYQEGRDVHYEVRYGEESNDKFDQHAREHVSAKVDLIWAASTLAATAAQKATASIPIVFALVGDPVYSGLVRGLAAPGANLTGMSLMISEMWGKRMEILTEIFPTVRRIGALHNPIDSVGAAQLVFVQRGAAALGKELMIVGARTPEEFAAAFAQLKRWQAQALLLVESSLFFPHRRTLLDAAAQNRWPTLHSTKDYVEAGGTVAYGADYVENCRSSAAYVDRIFKGAKPSDLPVQQPTKFQLAINLKAAKALGLTVPPQLLARADEVIE
jgi:putative tryptophan/tyrosine transport system substrate-binding protein